MDDQQQRDHESLLCVYERLYSQNHFLRTAIQNNTTWVGAALLAANGWVVATEAELAAPMKAVGIILYLWVGAAAVATLAAHYNEYNANAKLIVRIESALGLYLPDRHLSDESLFPHSSAGWGIGRFLGRYTGHIFATNCAILVSLTILSIGVLYLPRKSREEKGIKTLLERIETKLDAKPTKPANKAEP
jgi:uncharacterized membrane protein